MEGLAGEGMISAMAMKAASYRTPHNPYKKSKGIIKNILTSLRRNCSGRYIFYFGLLLTLLYKLFISWLLHVSQKSGERYLLYYNHDGFSNQIRALQRAAFLALATNRTLVLPPMLPHDDNKISPSGKWKSRSAGRVCTPYHRYKEFLKVIRDDVYTTNTKPGLNHGHKASKSHFPSFLEILDFSELTHRTGLKVMDLQEFSAMPYAKLLTRFLSCPGQMSYELQQNMREMFVPGCSVSKQASFSQLVPFFDKVCGKSHVALMGSAFIMPTVSKSDTYFSTEIQNEVGEHISGASPSLKMLKLLGKIHSRLPDGYTSVHIRFGDFLNIADCDDEVVKNAYIDVMTGLKEKNDARNGTHVLIGNGNKEAKRCFEHHAMGRYTVTTINDVISAHTDIQDLVNDIHTDDGNVFLFLDLILLSVAEHIVYAHAGVNANTFQGQIKFRHRRRKELLEKMALAISS